LCRATTSSSGMSRRQRRQPLLPLVVCRQGCPRLKGLIASRHLMPPGPCGSWKLLSTSVPASAAAMGAVPRCRLWLCGATATRQHWRPTTSPPPADRGLNNVRMGSESCLECYRSKRMSSADLLSFARSTSIHSPSLAAVFKVKDASTAPAGDGVAQRARSPRVSRR
jgi:hypothetical protein